MTTKHRLTRACSGVCHTLMQDRVPSRALALIGLGLSIAFMHSWIVQSSAHPIRLPDDIPPPKPLAPAIANRSTPGDAAQGSEPGHAGGTNMPDPSAGPEPGTSTDPSTTQGGTAETPTPDEPDAAQAEPDTSTPDTVEPVPMDPNTFGTDLTLAQTKYLYDLMMRGESILFVDARSGPDHYREGHIAGAIHASAQMIDAGDPDAMMELDMRDPANTRVVIYCAGGDCDESHTARTRLYNYGYTTTHIFTDGYPAWVDAGYPIVTGDRPEGD